MALSSQIGQNPDWMALILPSLNERGELQGFQDGQMRGSMSARGRDGRVVHPCHLPSQGRLLQQLQTTRMRTSGRTGNLTSRRLPFRTLDSRFASLKLPFPEFGQSSSCGHRKFGKPLSRALRLSDRCQLDFSASLVFSFAPTSPDSSLSGLQASSDWR